MKTEKKNVKKFQENINELHCSKHDPLSFTNDLFGRFYVYCNMSSNINHLLMYQKIFLFQQQMLNPS